MINLLDPTPLTPTEALILVLNAEDYVSNDERIPLLALAATLSDFATAEYLIRKEAVQASWLRNKLGRSANV